MKSWAKVFESKEAYKSEIVKDVLTDKKLNPVILNKKDSAYDIFGQYEVHVAPENAIVALRIIDNDINFE